MSEQTPIEEGEEIVYFVAIRTVATQGQNEIAIALERLTEEGLLPKPPYPYEHAAVVWYRPYRELTANDHERLRELGLDDFDARNRIVTVAALGALDGE